MDIELVAGELAIVHRSIQEYLQTGDHKRCLDNIPDYTDEVNRIITVLKRELPDSFADVDVVTSLGTEWRNVKATGVQQSRDLAEHLVQSKMTRLRNVAEKLAKRLDKISTQSGTMTEGGNARAKRPNARALDAATDVVNVTDVWHMIENDYGVSKKTFGKRINFVKDPFKRKVILRDIEQAYALARYGFNKPAVVLAGGVIEEILRLCLERKNIAPGRDDLNSYIEACFKEKLLKGATQRSADSVRQFRNIVHLKEESSPRHTISKATAKGAVASIFTIVNDIQIGP